jgi:chromosome partitioning protein
MILAIINQKGGVGKTTTAVTLAHGLARAGRSVLLVDLDAQGNVADALGMQKGPGLYELLIEGRWQPVPSGRPGLDLILGDKTTVQAKQVLTGRDFREYAVKEALEPAGDLYDVIVLDVAPGVDILHIAALVAATHFLIPVSLDHLALVGVGDALVSVASLRKVGAFRGQLLGVLPTFFERTTRESHVQLEILATQFKGLVWPPIPLDVHCREAVAHGQTLYEYAPGTRALAGARLAPNGKLIGGYDAALSLLQRELSPKEDLP